MSKFFVIKIEILEEQEYFFEFNGQGIPPRGCDIKKAVRFSSEICATRRIAKLEKLFPNIKFSVTLFNL